MTILFVLSLFVVAYTFIFYPLLIVFIGKVRPAPVLKTEELKEITILVVVYNEEDKIEKKIQNCLSCNYPADKISILFASDGSTDGTVKTIDNYGDPRIKAINFPERRGKAACLNDAIKQIKTEYIILTDSRQTFDESALIELTRNLNDDSVGAVSGELIFAKEGENTFSQSVDAYWRYEKFVRNAESQMGSVIGVTGAIYALKKSCFRAIPTVTVLDDVLIPMQVVMQGKRVLFESKAIAYDIPSSDPVREKKRKIRTLAGNIQLLALEPALLNPFKNRAVLQLVSHKLLRLLVPYFLMLLMLSNIILAFDSFVFALILFGQAIFYLLPLVGKNPNVKFMSIGVKISSAFLNMNWYAVLAMVEYFSNKNIHIWR